SEPIGRKPVAAFADASGFTSQAPRIAGHHRAHGRRGPTVHYRAASRSDSAASVPTSHRVAVHSATPSSADHRLRRDGLDLIERVKYIRARRGSINFNRRDICCLIYSPDSSSLRMVVPGRAKLKSRWPRFSSHPVRSPSRCHPGPGAKPRVGTLCSNRVCAVAAPLRPRTCTASSPVRVWPGGGTPPAFYHTADRSVGLVTGDLGEQPASVFADPNRMIRARRRNCRPFFLMMLGGPLRLVSRMEQCVLLGFLCQEISLSFLVDTAALW